MPFSTDPLLIALLFALPVAAIGLLWLLATRKQLGVRAAVDELAELRWREFQNLLEQWARVRGLMPVADEHSHDASGTPDVVLAHGAGRQLLCIKHGSDVVVGPDAVRELAARRVSRMAEAAILATTGRLQPQTAAMAERHAIKLIAEADLWQTLAQYAPLDLHARARLRADARQRRRMLAVGAASVVAGLAGWGLGLVFAALQSSDTPADAAHTSMPAAPVVQQAPAEVAAEPTDPAPRHVAPEFEDLDDDTLAARRLDIAIAVSDLVPVLRATWTSNSNLLIVLHAGPEHFDELLAGQVCSMLQPYAQLQLARLQFEVRETGANPLDPNDKPLVRWRRCD